MVKNGLSPAKVAEEFSVHRSTIHRWIKRVEKEGLPNLKCKPGRGVKSFLTAEQISELKKALSEPIPTDDGYYRGWQTKDAVQFVREKFKISYSKSRMRQIIKNLEFSKITCRPRSKRRNEALTNEFIAEVQKRSLNPKHLFVTQDGEFYWYDLGIKHNTDSYLKSLIDFKRYIGVKIVLILDRATWHRSAKAKEFYQNNKHWLQILFFPPATPDRNPTEYCWKTTREELTSIKSFKNIKVLKEEMDEF